MFLQICCKIYNKKNPKIIFLKDSKLPEPTEPTADDFKDQGNQCVRNSNFTEAILHYSTAIKLTPNDPILYSNRSLAFLKIQQLYYALEDAEKAISLKPDWAKV